MPAFIDLTGQKFGRLTVLGRGPSNRHKHTIWHCLCECGKETWTNAQHLRMGKAKSCGCFNRDLRRRICIERNTTHGESKTPEYRTWLSVRFRTTNPNCGNFKDYGGRGIRMCDRWAKFENFLADMGRKPSPKHTLDRIDPNGPYSPENCRWATMLQQQNNRTNNRPITAFGLTLTAPEWERRTGVKRATIEQRIRLGWSSEHAVTVTAKLGNRIKKISVHY